MIDDRLIVNCSCGGLIMSDRKVIKIQVKGCSDGLFWYSQHIGEQFDVVWFDPDEAVFWVRERDQYSARNWIACRDAEVIQ
jgi:hypothetical protein